MLPCIIHEDEHLLVVNKPAGWNTHAPSPYAGEGIYDWLRVREQRWASLAIIHRLDKVTSGVLVFAKTQTANRSLTRQFETRAVQKIYLFLTVRPLPKEAVTVKSRLARSGEKYVSRTSGQGGDLAETHFRVISDPGRPPWKVQAHPVTGRTHQIRAHAAEAGFPILGDQLYGGSPAPRVCLHSAEILFRHPATDELVRFQAPVDFQRNPSLELRSAFIEPERTNGFRLIHGDGDGKAGQYVDILGEFLLTQSAQGLSQKDLVELQGFAEQSGAKAVYHKLLNRQIRRTGTSGASPQLVWGELAPHRFQINENGLSFELSFTEGYSVGLFLDQRDNRRRLLKGFVTPDFPLFSGDYPLQPAAAPSILNTFAYTCGFSVCAAKCGAHTVSVDLSKKYLEWGRRNFILNGLSPSSHEFLFGDTFDWLRRFKKKDRRFALILLDPPTFSQSRETGVFQVETKLKDLVEAAVGLLLKNGVLFCSTNYAGWTPEDFLTAVREGIHAAHRRISQFHYAPQPPDFPVTTTEPAYLKTAWFRLE